MGSALYRFALRLLRPLCGHASTREEREHDGTLVWGYRDVCTDCGVTVRRRVYQPLTGDYVEVVP